MRPPVNSSALHVLQTLRLVCSSEEALSHAEISRRTALPSTTVYRALSTLEDAQYVQHAQGSLGYEAGIVPQLLLWTLLKRFPLSSLSEMYLARLAELSGGTASICIRLGWYGLRARVIYGQNDVYHRDRLGEVALLHTSGAMRGIFAFLTDREIEQYRRFAEKHHPDQSLDIERPTLRREVQSARNAGYYIAAAGASGEAPSFSMPLRDNEGRVVAAISLSGSALEVAPGKVSNLPENWKAVWREFASALAADERQSNSPYAHITPDDIILNLPARS
ncbi:MAG: IclR family transcriptional regulator C-terminal domain-containing protein [Rhizomicrobium sp.]